MNLSKLNVQELSTKEMRVVEGGVFPVAIWGLMIAIDAALIGVYATYDANGKLKH
ncbi:class IIb bacteriocin, lactobin A/cerein 7B family [Chryseobacterium gleum]|uniref:class IIb bacteriocin, lactobin A/cerein 7B family n=1 Tax=Chryseobacterium gleum TaxID=250 RepID=UPI001E3B8873|nr:class IIb bacteriocin, lactobin A/cerein 7B family [Chryseobacterium gleum]MCE4063535.1 class IIb bacteriocin, lactobin A/cerein 7B family [Chryseobacterium gleum]